MPHPHQAAMSADPQLDQFAHLPCGMRLCYRTYGNPQHPALVLIAGLGLQLVSWPQAWIDHFVQAGLYVVVPDNRDVGRSSFMSTPPPRLWRMAMMWLQPEHYTLDDMADDIAQLLRVLHIPHAHVLGMSMGGMIAQTLAARQSQVVRSLTSIFSTTGQRDAGQPQPAAMWALSKSKPPHTSAQAQGQYVAMMRVLGDATVPGIEQVWRHYADMAWQRSDNPVRSIEGRTRQATAILRSGNRVQQLQRIQCPTLVIHGDQDPIVHPSGGEATARAIPGARLMLVPGMRHQLDATQVGTLCAAIAQHVAQAQAVHHTAAAASTTNAAPASANATNTAAHPSDSLQT